MCNLKYMNKVVYKTETDSHRKQTYGYQTGKGDGEINQEFGISRYKLLYTKIDKNQGTTL